MFNHFEPGGMLEGFEKRPPKRNRTARGGGVFVCVGVGGEGAGAGGGARGRRKRGAPPPAGSHSLGARMPTTACAVSNEGMVAATDWPKDTSTSASVKVAR